jgi:hypothetical protein
MPPHDHQSPLQIIAASAVVAALVTGVFNWLLARGRARHERELEERIRAKVSRDLATLQARLKFASDARLQHANRLMTDVGALRVALNECTATLHEYVQEVWSKGKTDEAKRLFKAATASMLRCTSVGPFVPSEIRECAQRAIRTRENAFRDIARIADLPRGERDAPVHELNATLATTATDITSTFDGWIDEQLREIEKHLESAAEAALPPAVSPPPRAGLLGRIRRAWDAF